MANRINHLIRKYVERNLPSEEWDDACQYVWLWWLKYGKWDGVRRLDSYAYPIIRHGVIQYHRSLPKVTKKLTDYPAPEPCDLRAQFDDIKERLHPLHRYVLERRLAGDTLRDLKDIGSPTWVSKLEKRAIEELRRYL
jgi:DNA-directed RNA polymerase specialized sigma24 family protein